MATLNRDAPRLRWLRALVAAVVAEVVLACVAAPIFYKMGTNATHTLNLLVPPASFVVFVLAGWWAARPEPRNAVLTGALAGVWAVVLYIGLGFVASQFARGTSVTDGFTTAYLLAHVLKILGGALGGWLVSRSGERAA